MANKRKEFRTDIVIGGKVNKTMQKATKTACKYLGQLKGAALASVGVASAGMMFNNIKNFLGECVEKSKDQLEAELKLRNAVQNSAIYRGKDLKTLKQVNHQLLNEASYLQKIGVIGDEVTIAGQQQLMNYGLSADQVNKILPGMTNLLVKQKGLKVTQEDAIAVAKLFGKVLAGNAGALKKQGILYTKAEENIFKNGTKAQKLATLTKLLNNNVRDLNREMANSPEGKIQQCNNLWGDMYERVGIKLLPVMADLADVGIAVMPYIEKLCYAGITGFDNFYNSAKQAIDFIQVNGITSMTGFKDVCVITGGILAGIVAFNVIKGFMDLSHWVNVTTRAMRMAHLESTAMYFLMRGNLVKALIAGKAALIGYAREVWASVWAMRGFKLALASTGFGLLIVALGEIVVHWKDIVEWTKKAYDWFLKFLGIRKKEKDMGPVQPLPNEKFQPIPGKEQPQYPGSYPGHKALGCNSFVGGETWVGENGPEKIFAPRGSRILSNNQSKKTSAGIAMTNTFNISINGNADEATVKTALTESLQQFERKFNAMINNQKRLGYAPI